MKITRRAFLGTAAAAPWILTAGRPAPSERITMGLIGCGGMGTSNMKQFLSLPDVQVVAVCDVDSRWTLTKGGKTPFGRDEAKRIVEEKYAEERKSGAYKGCDAYSDFRELCARKDIDAVIVATPDHWHALVALEAIRSGKDVYGEKPITRRFREGRILADAVAKHGRIWQTGSQQRSEKSFVRAVEIARNGVLGKISRVEVGLPTGHKEPSGDVALQEPPAHLDYEFWCGPAAKLPYIPARVHWNWRWNMAFGAGQLLDWIGHHHDIAQWGLGRERSGPVAVEAVGFDYPADRSVWDAAVNYELLCTYEDGAVVSVSNRHPNGLKFIGEDGWYFVSRQASEASNPEWLKSEFTPGSFKIPPSPGHRRNFIDGVKARAECVAPAEIAHRSITAGHLGLLSQELGRKLAWDPKTETIPGDEEAMKKLNEVIYRDPWKL